MMTSCKIYLGLFLIVGFLQPDSAFKWSNTKNFIGLKNDVVLTYQNMAPLFALTPVKGNEKKRISTVTIPPLVSHQSSITFGGVKFGSPISSSMNALGLVKPSPIQNASVLLLTTGLSCILHAETGSGKTLAYLLPLLKRLIGVDGSIDRTPFQGLIIVPSKELAVQVRFVLFTQYMA